MKLVNVSGSNPNDLNVNIIDNIVSKNNVDKTQQ